jgi:hypothetical protein
MIAHSALWYAAAGLGLFGTYLIFAAGFHRLVVLSKLFPNPQAGQRLSIALLFGPVAGAWTYGWTLRLYSGANPWLYIIGSTAIWAVIALTGRGQFRSDIRQFLARAKKQSLTPLHFWSLLVMLLIAAVALLRIAWLNIWIPPYSNDPLEYMTAARLITGKLALLGVYPPINTAVTSGFYGPWTHPPGFALLMSWAQLLQGDLVNAGAVKFIDTYFLGAGAFLVFVFAGGALNFRGIIAAVLYILTPLLLSEVVEHHVDVSRIALWTGAFLAVSVWARNATPRASVFLGVLFGLGWFLHSIGLIALPIFLVLGLMVGRGRLVQRAAGIAIVAAVTIATVAADLLTNFRVFGRLVGDHVALLDYEPLRVAEHLRYSRGIFTPYETVRNGLLSPFTRYELAGIVPWLLLAAAVVIPALWLMAGRTSWRFWIRRAMRPTVVTVTALACLGFFGITLLSALLGSELIVKNMRYAMTSIGLASVLIATPVDLIFRLIRRRMREERRESTSTILSPEIMQADATRKIGQWVISLRQYAAKIAPHLPLIPAWVLVVAFAAASQVMFYRLSSFANLDPLTSRASDQVKFGMTNHPQFRMIARLNRLSEEGKWKPKGKVLAFRVADFAYYAKFGYLSYIDPAIMPAFKSASAREAYGELRKLGVSYLALPSYTLPEVYNSAIGALLADATATRILISDEGYRVLELLETPETPQLTNVAQEGPIPVLQFPKTGGTILKTLPGSAEPLQLDAEHRITSNYGGAPDATLFNGWDGQYNAFFVGAPLKTANGEHLLTVNMSGSGFARIGLVYQGQEIQLLWEGLVPSDVRQMSAHFDLAQIRTIASEGKSGPEDDYGLTVSLKAGSSLRLEGVTISRVGERKSIEALRTDLVSELLLDGYDLSVSNYPADKLFLEPSAQLLEAKDLDGRQLSVSFPSLYSRDTELLGSLYPIGRLNSTVTLGGTGFRDVSFSAQCSRFEPQGAADFSDTELFADRYLMTGRDRIYRFEADVACKAKSARLKVGMWRPLVKFETEQPKPVYRFGSNSTRYSFTLETNKLNTIDMTRLAR